MDYSKRYLLFAFDHYYPEGGLNDCRGSFDTVKAAQDKFDEGSYGSRYDTGHIFDQKEKAIIPVDND